MTDDELKALKAREGHQLMGYVVVIFLILAVLVGPVALLPIVLVGAILKTIPLAGYAMIFLGYLTFAKAGWFFAQPPRIVIPGIIAWGGSLLALLFWLSMPATPITPAPTPTPTACAGSDDPLSVLSPAERAYLTGCH